MKTKIYLALIIIISGSLFQSCKKYDEDEGAITLRSVKNRLTNGTWELERFTVDGVDSTIEYSEVDFNFSFTKTSNNGSGSVYSYYQEFTFDGELFEIDGDVYFSNNGETIRFVTYDYNYNYNYTYSYNYIPEIFYSNYVSDSPKWNIDKLTNKEFVLRSTFNGKKYLMQLIKN